MIRYPTVNRFFTTACFASPPVLGSAVSFIWHGGAIWCLFEVLSHRRRLSDDRYVRTMTAFAYLYAVWAATCALYNGLAIEQADVLLPLVTFLLFPFSYSIWTISDRAEIARACILASMAASYGACVLAVVQFYGLGMRAEGGAGNALVFASVASLAGSVCLAGAFTLERRLAGALIGGYFASVLSIMYAESRVFWLITAVTTLFVLWTYRRQLRDVLSRRIVLAAGGLALVLILLGFELVLPRALQLLRDWHMLVASDDYNTSLGLRLALWKIGLGLFRESWLFGHGLQNTKLLIHHALQDDFGISRGFSHFHNGILTLLVESGVIGAAGVLGFFATICVNAWRTLRRGADATAMLGGTMLAVLAIVYLLSGMTNLLIGHDILDAVLMVFAIVATWLSSTAPTVAPARSDVPAAD